jgi:hypothetical protein
MRPIKSGYKSGHQTDLGPPPAALTTPLQPIFFPCFWHVSQPRPAVTTGEKSNHLADCFTQSHDFVISAQSQHKKTMKETPFLLLIIVNILILLVY